MYFPTADISISPFLPPLAAFAISFFTSMGGVSGAFLLLPLQVSLGYDTPSVSATNHLFNVIATPGGVWRYYREGRLLTPLVKCTVLGCLPGVLIGAFIRLEWLADGARFKTFAALILLFLALRLLIGLRRSGSGQKAPGAAHPILLDSSFWSFRFSFQDREYACDLRAFFLLTLLIGLAGGIYGIGGGSILAPLLAAGFRLPVHVTAGPTLLCTFATSAGGVLIYLLLAPLYPGLTVIPDWTLGLLFGLGGLAGMYAGARCQKYIPARPIRLLLAIVILGTAAGWLFPPR